jgi:hypothetical protein
MMNYVKEQGNFILQRREQQFNKHRGINEIEKELNENATLIHEKLHTVEFTVLITLPS